MNQINENNSHLFLRIRIIENITFYYTFSQDNHAFALSGYTATFKKYLFFRISVQNEGCFLSFPKLEYYDKNSSTAP